MLLHFHEGIAQYPIITFQYLTTQTASLGSQTLSLQNGEQRGRGLANGHSCIDHNVPIMFEIHSSLEAYFQT